MSPHPGWCKRTFSAPRKWESPDAFPFSEVADVTRGHIRFAAEVMLAEIHGKNVPLLARDHAIETLNVLARR